ncbi:hypothetical protein GQR58_026545 [Nymphon striatum]|nr:hypothetical protein GQR58_026545 [Nymphon striatum]
MVTWEPFVDLTWNDPPVDHQSPKSRSHSPKGKQCHKVRRRYLFRLGAAGIKRYRNHENSADVIRQWQETYQTPPPLRQTICQIRDKFKEPGSVVDAQRSGRPKTSCTEDNKHPVAQSVIVQSPEKSTRLRSLELGINRRSLQIMLKELNYTPYVLQVPGITGTRYYRYQVLQVPGITGTRYYRYQVLQVPGITAHHNASFVR